MKKVCFLILCCFSLVERGYADYFGSYEGCANCFGFESVLTFDVGGGYRSDNLNWKRFPSETSEISEKWENIGMGVVETNASFLACEHYLFRADFDSGWFEKSGKQTYTTYSDNVLTEELKARTRGQVYDVSGGIGYQFNIPCYRTSIAPLVGYSYNYQRFKNSQYVNQLTDPEVTTTSHNRYKYRWNGPWLGLDLVTQPYCDLLIFFDYEFHWSTLNADIHENFVEGQEPAKVKLDNCYGNEYTVGSSYVFCDEWFLGLKFNYKQFWGNKGHYRVEDQETKIAVRDLNWETYSITLDVGYNF